MTIGAVLSYPINYAYDQATQRHTETCIAAQVRRAKAKCSSECKCRPGKGIEARRIVKGLNLMITGDYTVIQQSCDMEL